MFVQQQEQQKVGKKKNVGAEELMGREARCDEVKPGQVGSMSDVFW